MKTGTLLPLLLCFVLSFRFTSETIAQSRNSAVYFGPIMGWGSVASVPLDSFVSQNSNVSCISDEAAGEFLFCSDGHKVWLERGVLMEEGLLNPRTEKASDVLIVPDPASSSLYYIFYVLSNNLYYAKVDMTGGGKVTNKKVLAMTNVASSMTAVYALRQKKSWWLISHSKSGNTYYSFLINETGISSVPVISQAGKPADGILYEMKSSHKGDVLMASGVSATNGKAEIELLDIDKRCGTISKGRILYTKVNSYNIPLSDFSPDDSKIYIKDLDNTVLQCSGSDYTSRATIMIDEGVNWFGMITYQDVIYIAGMEIVNGMIGLYRINNPDYIVPLCTYEPYIFFDYEADKALGRPRQIMEPLQPKVPFDFVFNYACARFKAEFFIPDSVVYDSFSWDFGDAASGSSNVASGRIASHTYLKSGNYEVELTGYKCGYVESIYKTLQVRDRFNPVMGPDTIICSYASLTLISKIPADEYLWSDNSTLPTFTLHDPGKYWLRIKVGDCYSYDTITVDKYPHIWTALGEEYYICTDEKEVVKLDAGEGFETYRWYPTGDSTRWIDVSAVGDYFVIVGDYMGCNGYGGTKVKRRCPVKVFFPNAFTPNEDGVNDEYVPAGKDITAFKMAIYNAWGELVFETNDIGKTWDGTYKGKSCATGVYLYKAYYEGYRHKQLVSLDAKGNITLLR